MRQTGHGREPRVLALALSRMPTVRTSFYDKAERAIGGAAAEVDMNKLSRQFDALLDDGRVLKCGDIKIFKLPDGKVGSNRQGVPLKIMADDKNIYLDGKPCVLLKCDQSASC
jgi:hypothetical protein